MLVIKNRKHGIDFYKVWFAKEPLDYKGIIEYHQSGYEGKGSEDFDTLFSDITGTPDEIKGVFAKNCRYKVNRAEREDVNVRFIDSDKLTDEDIEKFIVFFKDFWESKGTPLSEEAQIRRDLGAYKDAGALSFSIASVHGEDAVYHTHIYDEERARLLHSASLYRLISGEESDSRNLIGMANRYLHYADMLHFKEMGKKIYDWGGAGKGEDVANITEFKQSFGGEPKTEHDFSQVRGIKAKAFRFIADALDDVIWSR